MEDGQVHTNAASENTLVQIELDGKLRHVSVSREWIEDQLQLSPGEAAALSDEDRREWVRSHLPEVIEAANAQRFGADADAAVIMVHTQNN